MTMLRKQNTTNNNNNNNNKRQEEGKGRYGEGEEKACVYSEAGCCQDHVCSRPLFVDKEERSSLCKGIMWDISDTERN